ncbi:hypothetical protein ACFL26_02035 [Patescibacteria group bacterium]
MSKKKDQYVTINKKALIGLAFAAPIIGVLLSKREPGVLLLFLIGIAIGIFVGWHLRK